MEFKNGGVYDFVDVRSVVVVILLAAVLGRLLSNYLHLRRIPGPVLAGSTNLWRAYYQIRGQLRGKIVALHEQYGPVVRYGVNMVSIQDAGVVQQIYATGKGFTIHDSYSVLLGIDDKGRPVESLVTVKDEAKHGQMRRAVANAFTPTSVSEMEGIIDEAVAQLMETLYARAANAQAVDISRTLLWYSLDNAAKMVFSEDAGCLRTDSDAQGLGKAIRARFAHWGAWAALPELESLVYRNSIALRMSKTQPAEFARKAAAHLADRLAKPWMTTEKDLLNRFISARANYPDVLHAKAIMGLIMSTVSGAADTTAASLVGTLYYLITHPEAKARLQQELLAAQVTQPVPRYSETRHLPYLDAVIKEAMRLFSVLNWPAERRVPPGGMTFNDYFFPENTSVGVLPAALHMSRSVFGADVEDFRPERWLSNDLERTRRMDASFLGFSRGKRVCLGQNIAILQLKKVIPAIILSFKLELQDHDQVLDADYSLAVILVKPLFLRLGQKETI